MAVTQMARHLPGNRDAVDQMKSDQHADRVAERLILLTIAAVAGTETLLLVWLIL